MAFWPVHLPLSSSPPAQGLLRAARPRLPRAVAACCLAVCLLLMIPSPGWAQSSAPQSAANADSANSGSVTIFPHPDGARWWVSGQVNIIFQWHPAFPALYTGPNSLTPEAQSATTHVVTLYTGYRLTHTTEVLADVEDATGGGIGNATGLAGETDLDSVRTVQGVQLSTSPYLARLMLHQIIPLGSDSVAAGRGPLGLATLLPARRIEFRIGKFDLADFFDNNSGGSDTHSQFMNWTVDNDGAWDYAANTRGYTDAAMAEFDDGRWAVRFAEALMPKVANGIYLDADLARARSENLEGQVSGDLLPGRLGTLRILSYVNHADMGDYREAIARYLEGLTPQPDIIATRVQGRVKYGFGVNVEQELAPAIGIFGRFGWNNGRTESFAYTEDDQTVELGASFPGATWLRRLDKAGIAFVSNGISGDHREYLQLGGEGFLLGDGNLSYGREDIFEAYYNAHLWSGIFAGFDIQHINNPGYNRVRGPVLVPGLRLHLEF